MYTILVAATLKEKRGAETGKYFYHFPEKDFAVDHLRQGKIHKNRRASRKP